MWDGIRPTSSAYRWYARASSYDILTFILTPGHVQGGGIAASFVDQFPHLVGDRLALLASAGIVEVSVAGELT